MNRIEVQNLYNEVMNKIDNKEDIDEIKEKIKQYSIEKMTLDFHNENSKSQIEDISKYIIEFIDKAQAKGYFFNENIYENLKILTIKDFEEDCDAYGDYKNNSTLRLKLQKGYGRIPDHIGLKHIVFHELAHAITPVIGGNGGIFKMEISAPKIHIQGQPRIPKSPELIFNNDARTFLREIIAEATACDLADDYQFVPTIVNGIDYSDWLVPLNRTYQTLGDTFLRTIFRNCEDSNGGARKRFKELTMKAMKPDNCIVEDIISVYSKKNPKTWKKDLHELTSIFGNIYLSKKFEQVDRTEFNKANEIMQKYLQIRIIDPKNKPTITILDKENTR